MCRGPLLVNIVRFSLPVIFANILQLMFGAVDMVIVGRFAGSEALAAVGSNISLINLIINLFVGMSAGVNVVTARHFGAQSGKDIRETVHTSVFVSILCGISLALFGICFAAPALTLMGTPDQIIGEACLYLRIYSAGMPAIMLFNFSSAIVTASGDTRRPMYCLIAAGIANVFLNLLFVVSLRMGAAGAATATALANWLSAGLMIRHLCRNEGDIGLDFRKLRIDREKLAAIMKVGIPAGLQGVGFSISNVIVQSAVNSFGETAIAGNTATINIEGFLYMAMYGFYQSASTFTSQNVGARRYDRVDRVLYICLGCAALSGAAAAWTALLFHSQILGIYSPDPGVAAVGFVRMAVIFPIYAFCGMNDVMAGSMRGMGYATTPLIVSTLGTCVFRIVWIFTAFQLFRSLEILYLSYPVSWILTFGAHFICFKVIRRKMDLRLAEGMNP